MEHFYVSNGFSQSAQRFTELLCVNIHGADHGRVTAVPDGAVFVHAAADGWHAAIGSRAGRLPGKDSEITEE
ncbi:MAG: hypothetical protein IKP72_09285 [Clostridia bacterium]|nr:hypothetical protein [Clostridia bacterium]MBR6706817.1 hypothetical protein [Clostridia bacterium]